MGRKDHDFLIRKRGDKIQTSKLLTGIPEREFRPQTSSNENPGKIFRPRIPLNESPEKAFRGLNAFSEFLDGKFKAVFCRLRLSNGKNEL
jgi:hypothetical protein